MATIDGTNNAERLTGTSTADTIRGYGGGDTIRGMGGDDLILGGEGGDLLDGGGGYDTIFYYDSNVGVTVNLATGRGYGGTAEGDGFVSIEAVWGSFYNDTITGRDDADELLYGLDGHDVLKGGGGADALDGGAGNDILKGGGGADTLIGGGGNDTADYSQSTAGVIVHLYGTIVSGGDATGDVLFDIENLTGSAYQDDLQGTDGANVLKGLDGADGLFAAGGDDTLDGGNGDDFLNGGAGVDRMTGGAGNDGFIIDNTADVVVEAAGGGYDVLRSSVSYSLAPTVEIEAMLTTDLSGTDVIHFGGNDFAQSMYANAADNVLSGLGGADHLRGLDGNDQLYGGTGADILNGGVGNDRFVFSLGEAQDDTLEDFLGNGAGDGDSLYFLGFGPGATFTQIDATRWQVNYSGGTSHEVITFANGAAVHASDVVFL